MVALQVPLDLRIAQEPLEVSTRHRERQRICAVGLLDRFEISQEELVLLLQHGAGSFRGGLELRGGRLFEHLGLRDCQKSLSKWDRVCAAGNHVLGGFDLTEGLHLLQNHEDVNTDVLFEEELDYFRTDSIQHVPL